jgi:hypothetical protein
MATSSLNDAMARIFEADLQLKKDASANYGNYATLGNVLEVLRPALVKNGLTVEQAPDIFEGTPCLTTLILHSESDQARVYHTPLILDKQTSQGMGSAVTYARRYALVSIFFMDADEDDDGAAGETSAKVVSKKSAESAGAKPRVL